MLYRKQLTREQALQKLRQYCGYQERCHSEVKDKLYELGVRKIEHDEMISTLIEEDYLNEERFTLAFTRGKFNLKQWGRIKIRAELKKKRVSDYCINKSMQQIEEPAYISVLEKLAMGKYELLKDEQHLMRKKKTMDYLLQKGYEMNLIQEIIKSFCVVLLACFLSLPLAAQVKITPIVKQGDATWMTFSFPFIQSKNAEVAKNINEYLQDQILANEKIETDPKRIFETIRYISQGDSAQSGDTYIKYSVLLNGPNILSLKFDIETMGAYPESHAEYYNFNLADGEFIGAGNLFTQAGLKQIEKILIAKRKKLIDKAIAGMKKDFAGGNAMDDSAWIKETFASCNEDASVGNISIRKNSILFYKEYCFPHVARPFDTDLDILISLKELEKYLSVIGRGILKK